MATKKKTDDTLPAESPTTQSPQDVLKVLAYTQEALHELADASGLGTVAQWEFSRARAHRPNAACISLARTMIAEILGPYVPVAPEVRKERLPQPGDGVKYNPQS